MVHVRKSVQKVSEELVEKFRPLPAATVYEAAGQHGMIDPGIRAVYPEAKVCGRALTVFCHIGDNLMIHKAVSIAHPGDVLVVSIRNDTRSGAWGEILTTFARSKGVVGLVIDGAVRDAEATRNRNFPVFSRGLAVGATVKRSLGQINHPVAIGDQIVHPGDLIVGDIDGVVVVPRERAGSVYEASVERERKEEKLMEKISAGATTLDLLGLDSVLDELGLVEE